MKDFKLIINITVIFSNTTFQCNLIQTFKFSVTIEII